MRRRLTSLKSPKNKEMLKIVKNGVEVFLSHFFWLYLHNINNYGKNI